MPCRIASASRQVASHQQQTSTTKIPAVLCDSASADCMFGDAVLLFYLHFLPCMAPGKKLQTYRQFSYCLPVHFRICSMNRTRKKVAYLAGLCAQNYKSSETSCLIMISWFQPSITSVPGKEQLLAQASFRFNQLNCHIL